MTDRNRLAGLRILVVGENCSGFHEVATALLQSGAWVSSIPASRLEHVGNQMGDLVVVCDWLAPGTVERTCAGVRNVSQAPVVVLTNGDTLTAVAAFDAGADYCAAWPIDAGELSGRLAAVLRRTTRVSAPPDEIVGPSGLVVRARAHYAAINGETLNPTPREFAVLQLLLERRGEVLTRDVISREVWGHETFGQHNFVEAQVAGLRAKLRAAGAGDIIMTVRGVGYVIR